MRSRSSIESSSIFDALEQFLDRLGAHHGLEAGGAVLLVELAEAVLVLDDLALLDRRVAWIDDDVGLEVENASSSRSEMSSRWPMREGRPLKNQTCEQGEASSMWPRRSRRTLETGDFDAALVADDAAVLHALVLAAEALPVGDRSKDAGAEEAVALRLEGAVVDGLGLGDFAMRPAADLLREAS
jgi:hypothetical protein